MKYPWIYRIFAIPCNRKQTTMHDQLGQIEAMHEVMETEIERLRQLASQVLDDAPPPFNIALACAFHEGVESIKRIRCTYLES
jgi:hypothetical protein